MREEIPNLLTVRAFAAKHSAFSESSLRWLIFNASGHLGADSNGLSDALVRIGRRVFIDEVAFFEWARSRTPSDTRGRLHGGSGERS